MEHVNERFYQRSVTIPFDGAVLFTPEFDPLVLSWNVGWGLADLTTTFAKWVHIGPRYRAPLQEKPRLHGLLPRDESARDLAKASCQVHVCYTEDSKTTGSGVFVARQWFVTAAHLFEYDEGEYPRPKDPFKFAKPTSVYVTTGPSQEAHSRDEGRRIIVDRVVWPGKFSPPGPEEWRDSDVVFCHVTTETPFYCTPHRVNDEGNICAKIELCAYGYPKRPPVIDWAFDSQIFKAILKQEKGASALEGEGEEGGDEDGQPEAKVQEGREVQPRQRAATELGKRGREAYEKGQASTTAWEMHDIVFAGYSRLVTSVGVFVPPTWLDITSNPSALVQVSLSTAMSGGAVAVMDDQRVRPVGIISGGIMNKDLSVVFVFAASLPFMAAYLALIGNEPVPQTEWKAEAEPPETNPFYEFALKEVKESGTNLKALQKRFREIFPAPEPKGHE